jgi:hypothetical protein
MWDRLTRRKQRQEEVELILDRAEQAAAQVSKLQELVRQIQAENRKLRRLTHMQESVRIVRKAHEAALKLAAMHLAGMKTGRKSARKAGSISERTFFYARALLELASVYADGEFVTDDVDLIESNLRAAARSAERDFHLLWRRLPPSRRPKIV